jgi:transcriptional regulator with XRE-family HTH domain
MSTSATQSNALREVRRLQGLSRRELAERAGVTAKTVQNLEGGSVPRLTTAMRLAEALGTSVATLWPMKETNDGRSDTR